MKLKTSKSVSKRIINFTNRGKIMRRAVSAQHLAANKSKRTHQKAGRPQVVKKADTKKINRLVPYK